MNDCMTVTAYPVGDLHCTATAVGGFHATATPVGEIRCVTTATGRIRAHAIPVGRLRCRVYQSCTVNIGGRKYLEIDPEIIWILSGWSSNDVYSNTTWRVD